MKLDGTIRALILGALVVGLSGCATSPISKNLRQQAKPLSLAEVAANPSAYIGATVIWGGQVINTLNSTNGASIYVLQLPLNREGRPTRHAVSSGRFIARRQGFIDPEVFKNGRLITVAATIAGVKTEPLQNIQYTYPVVDIQELHVWHPRPPYYYYPGWGWGWGWGGYGPGYGWYGPGGGWGWYGPGWGPNYNWNWDWD